MNLFEGIFLTEPTTDMIVRAMLQSASDERDTANKLTVTPDEPYIADAPTNGEIAAGLLSFARKIDSAATDVACGQLKPTVSGARLSVYAEDQEG
jgi:hypothetical protein